MEAPDPTTYIQTLVSLLIYGVILWLIWVLVTSIADGYNQHFLGQVAAVIFIILFLPIKWVYDKAKGMED